MLTRCYRGDCVGSHLSTVMLALSKGCFLFSRVKALFLRQRCASYLALMPPRWVKSDKHFMFDLPMIIRQSCRLPGVMSKMARHRQKSFAVVIRWSCN